MNRRQFLKLATTGSKVFGIGNIFLPLVQKNRWLDIVDLLTPMNKRLGAAINSGGLDTYGTFVHKHFTSVTADAEMKMAVVNPGPGQFDFRATDKILEYAEDHLLQVHGHTLVWDKFLPPWVVQLGDPASVRAATEEFITTCLSYYETYFPHQLSAWDVVNEPINADGTEKETVFGTGYIEWALEFVRRHYSGQIFINDYQMSKAWMDTILRFADRGLIDGVGMQFHLAYNAVLPMKELFTFAEELLRRRVHLRITESDVYIPMNATHEHINMQVELWKNVARFVRDTHCDTWTFWGVTDADSWIPTAQPGHGSALLWDEHYLPKTPYWAVYHELLGN